MRAHAGRMTPTAGGATRPRVLRVRRPARGSRRGVSMVEFGLLAPLVFLLLLSIIVGGVFAMNYVQLSNAARDGARAAAVCGGSGRSSAIASTPTLPDGTACTDTNLISYVKGRFQAIDKNIANLSVTLPTGGTGDHMSQCQYGKTVEITIAYDQPFYVPLVGRVLSNNGTGKTFTIRSSAEAGCEV